MRRKSKYNSKRKSRKKSKRQSIKKSIKKSIRKKQKSKHRLSSNKKYDGSNSETLLQYYLIDFLKNKNENDIEAYKKSHILSDTIFNITINNKPIIDGDCYKPTWEKQYPYHKINCADNGGYFETYLQDSERRYTLINYLESINYKGLINSYISEIKSTGLKIETLNNVLSWIDYICTIIPTDTIKTYFQIDYLNDILNIYGIELNNNLITNLGKLKEYSYFRKIDSEIKDIESYKKNTSDKIKREFGLYFKPNSLIILALDDKTQILYNLLSIRCLDSGISFNKYITDNISSLNYFNIPDILDRMNKIIEILKKSKYYTDEFKDNLDILYNLLNNKPNTPVLFADLDKLTAFLFEIKDIIKIIDPYFFNDVLYEIENHLNDWGLSMKDTYLFKILVTSYIQEAKEEVVNTEGIEETKEEVVNTEDIEDVKEKAKVSVDVTKKDPREEAREDKNKYIPSKEVMIDYIQKKTGYSEKFIKNAFIGVSFAAITGIYCILSKDKRCKEYAGVIPKNLKSIFNIK